MISLVSNVVVDKLCMMVCSVVEIAHLGVGRRIRGTQGSFVVGRSMLTQLYLCAVKMILVVKRYDCEISLVTLRTKLCKMPLYLLKVKIIKCASNNSVPMNKCKASISYLNIIATSNHIFAINGIMELT